MADGFRRLVERAGIDVPGVVVARVVVEKLKLIAKARFGRLSEENILEKRDRNRRRAGGFGGQRRAG